MAASGVTTYGKQQMLIISTGLIPPPTLYLALFSTSGDPGGTTTELAVSNYARQPVPFYVVQAGQLANATDITFYSLGTGTFLGQQLLDASTGTTVWCWIDQASSVGFTGPTDLTYPAGTLTLLVS